MDCEFVTMLTRIGFLLVLYSAAHAQSFPSIRGTGLELSIKATPALAGCRTGKACLYWDGNTTGPKWKKADGTTLTLGAGGGASGSTPITMSGAFGSSYNAGLTLENTTAATDEGQGLESPALVLVSRLWNGSASAAGGWALWSLPFDAGTTDTPLLQFGAPGGATAYFSMAVNGFFPTTNNTHAIGTVGANFAAVNTRIVQSDIADGGGAAVVIGSTNTLATAGDLITSFKNVSSQVASIDYTGKFTSAVSTLTLNSKHLDLVTSADNGDVLTYDSGTSTWKAAAAGAAGGGAFVEAHEKLCIGQAVISSGTFGNIGNGTTTGFADTTTGSLGAGDYTVCFNLSGWWTGSTCEVEHQMVIDGSPPGSQTSGRTAAEGSARQGAVRRCMGVTLGAGTHTLAVQARLTGGSVGNCAIDGTSDNAGSSLYWEIYSR